MPDKSFFYVYDEHDPDTKGLCKDEALIERAVNAYGHDVAEKLPGGVLLTSGKALFVESERVKVERLLIDSPGVSSGFRPCSLIGFPCELPPEHLAFAESYITVVGQFVTTRGIYVALSDDHWIAFEPYEAPTRKIAAPTISRNKLVLVSESAEGLVYTDRSAPDTHVVVTECVADDLGAPEARIGDPITHPLLSKHYSTLYQHDDDKFAAIVDERSWLSIKLVPAPVSGQFVRENSKVIDVIHGPVIRVSCVDVNSNCIGASVVLCAAVDDPIEVEDQVELHKADLYHCARLIAEALSEPLSIEVTGSKAKVSFVDNTSAYITFDTDVAIYKPESFTQSFERAYLPMLAKDHVRLEGGDDVPMLDKFAQVKFDGMRCLATIDSGVASFFSRSGRKLKPLVPRLSEIVTEIGGATKFDGELLSMYKTRAQSTGYVHRNEAGVDENMCYIIFTYVGDVPAIERHNLLLRQFDAHPDVSSEMPDVDYLAHGCCRRVGNVFLAKLLPLKTQGDVAELRKLFPGQEGIMIYDQKEVYRRGRTRAILKSKNFSHLKLPVKRLCSAGGKEQGCALFVVSFQGRDQVIRPRGSYDFRRAVLSGDIVVKSVEIRYSALTSDGNLEMPVVIRFYDSDEQEFPVSVVYQQKST